MSATACRWGITTPRISRTTGRSRRASAVRRVLRVAKGGSLQNHMYGSPATPAPPPTRPFPTRCLRADSARSRRSSIDSMPRACRGSSTSRTTTRSVAFRTPAGRRLPTQVVRPRCSPSVDISTIRRRCRTWSHSINTFKTSTTAHSPAMSVTSSADEDRVSSHLRTYVTARRFVRSVVTALKRSSTWDSSALMLT